MKTPREILFAKHQPVAPKLDAIRAEVVAGLQPPVETLSWRLVARSLRWHVAGWSAAWMVVMVLNGTESTGPVPPSLRENAPSPQELWTSLRASRRLLLEYTDTPMAEVVEPASGRRSQINNQERAV